MMIFQRLSRFLFGSLRGRLVLGVAAVHALMMALFIADLTQRQRDMLLVRQIEEATALSQSLATSGAVWIAAADVSGLQQIVEVQQRYPELLFAMIADRDGRVLADTDPSRRGRYLLDLPSAGRVTVLKETPSLVDVVAPAMIAGRQVGWARVGIGQKVASEKLGEIIRDGVFYALAAILIGSVIAWFMGRRITGRLYAVQETINAVRSGDRQARSLITGFDEAAVMAREFNAMLDAIADRDVELHASEERYRSLIDKVRTAIVLHDGQGQILNHNLLAQELLGLTSEQLLGKALLDPEWHFLREDGSVLPVDEYPVSKVRSTGQPLRNEVTGIHRPGSDEATWALVNAEPEYDEAGHIAQIIVSFADITERKKAGEKLRLASEEIYDLYNRAPCGYHSLDKDGVYLLINETELEWLGYRREEVVGKLKFTDLVTAHSLRKFQDNFPRFKSTGEIRDIEFEMIRKDGSILPVSLSATAIFDSDGNYLMSRSMVYDIAERKLAEEKRQESEERFRLILEAMQIGIFDWDVGQDRWVASPVYYTMLGYEPKDGPADRQEWLERVHPDDQALVVEKIQGLLVGKPSADSVCEYEYEVRLRHADGSYRWEYVKGFAIKRDQAGKASRILGARMDITDRKRAEEEIRKLNQQLEQRVKDRTAQLEAANMELEAFSYSVSHDLRAPLRAIDGFSHILLEDHADKLDKEGKRLFKVVRDNTSRMGQLIDDMLQFSRTGRIEIYYTDIDMERTAREVIDELQSNAPGKGKQQFEIEPIPPAKGDRNMLRQVFINLLSNAIKFSQTREIPRIKVGATIEGNETLYFVQDNGVGFDMQYVEKVFGVFQRLHSINEFEGTGIGLAIVKRIINRHGGRVWAEGKVNEGATIYFTLPRGEINAP